MFNMADLEEDASLPSIRRSQRTVRRRPSRYGDDESTAMEDSGQGLGPADPANFLEDASQDEDQISLKDVHQESADVGGGPNVVTIVEPEGEPKTEKDNIANAQWGLLKGYSNQD